MEAEEKAVEKRAKSKVHDENAPAAAAKLEKNSRVVSTLTVKEIKAIHCKVYNITFVSTRKPDCIKALESQMGSNIDKYNDYLWLLAADNAAVANDNAAMVPVVPPALATIEDVRTAESEEEVEEPVNDSLEDREEKEVDEDSAYDMDGGVLVADDADYDFDDQDANEHDTNLIDANVMDNDTLKEDRPLAGVRSGRLRKIPARFSKECEF